MRQVGIRVTVSDEEETETFERYNTYGNCKGTA